jgi:hypothetical protein
MSLCVVTRSTGTILLIIPGYYFGHKIWRNALGLTIHGKEEQVAEEPTATSRIWSFLVGIWNFIRGTKYMFGLITVLLMMISPIFVISFWKPYEMYCLSRLDTTLEVPPWCYDKYPNVYSHIQKLYWNTSFLGFLDRPWYLFCTSLFTNQFFLYVIYRMISGHSPLNFFTLNVFKSHQGESNDEKSDVFRNRGMYALGLVFILNMLLVLLMGNSEINSRVASTCPFYFYALAQLILEVRDEIRGEKAQVVLPFANNNKGSYKHGVVMIALIYNAIVLYLNLLLFGNEIGFI